VPCAHAQEQNKRTYRLVLHTIPLILNSSREAVNINFQNQLDSIPLSSQTKNFEVSSLAKEFPVSKFSGCFFDFLPLNLLLVRSHQTEIIVVKRLIQGHNNETRVGVEPRSHDRRKNGALTLLATLPIIAIGYFKIEKRYLLCSRDWSMSFKNLSILSLDVIATILSVISLSFSSKNFFRNFLSLGGTVLRNSRYHFRTT